MNTGLEPKRESAPAVSTPRTTELTVTGMTCTNCQRHVAEALENVPGVALAKVDLETGRAVVEWSPGMAPDDGALFRAVREAGYEPERQKASFSELNVKGMTCSGCARNVAEALQSVAGVDRVDVRLEESRAQVHWKTGAKGNENALVEVVKKAGYEAALAPGAEGMQSRTAKWSPFSGWFFNVVVGSVLTIPLMVLEWGFGAGMERWYHWFAFACVIPIQTLCGARFYRGAWNQLRAGHSNMDTLVVLGSTAAFGYSCGALFQGASGHLFFMESASIITLISVGHWVESKVSARAAKSLRALLDLAPQKARILDPGGAEVEVAVASLQLGDQVVIKPGDKVPIDSEVIDGASAVDESMLTGESVPVNKAKGSRIYAGTTNMHGWLLGRVSATGSGTALAQIIAVVERAQASRANIQKLGDKVSSIFVPIVVLIALGTGLWWGLAPESARAFSAWLQPLFGHSHNAMGPVAAAIYHAAAVLIVACPCAMGLATPIAVMAGANVAAERGILIRDGIALEKTGMITAILFDKTGTLTQGKLALADAEDFLLPSEQALGFHKIAASLAKRSLHPLSQTVAGFSNVFLPVTDWEEVRGAGVQGRLTLGTSSLDGAQVRLGSLSWMRDLGVDLKGGAEFIEKWSDTGSTILGLAADTRLLGLIALQDSIKPNAKAVIESLQRQGKAVYLVTGDNKRTAVSVARSAGIPSEHVFAEIRPEEKANIIVRLQKEQQRVAFVGDGINDAPALEQADLGIAVARASDVAREAADIILLNSDIQAVPEAIALAQATLRTIKQNLFWAFFYNVCSIPLAVVGFLSPILSAFAMGASDLIVIGNALRLRRWKFRR